MTLLFRCAAIIAAGLLAGSAAAVVRKPVAKAPVVPIDDLTVAATRHVANCPSPKLSACVIKKPVDSSYRVLTPGVELDDKGDHWVADFGKSTEAKILLRVLGRNGDLHEIEVSFGKKTPAKGGPAPKASPAPK